MYIKITFFLQLIKAHKIYLAQSSPVFDAMFFGKMTEGDVTNELVVSIPDLSPASFKELLQYECSLLNYYT